MNFSNCIELYEAIFLFQKLKGSRIYPDERFCLHSNAIDHSIEKALAKILITNNLLRQRDDGFFQSDENINDMNNITSSVGYKNNIGHLENFAEKALDKRYDFFSHLSDVEFDLYSRWNFEVNLKIGEQAAKYLDLSNCKVIELGGNSGGFATSVVKKSNKCYYTIIDNKIPCRVGNQLKKMSSANLLFIENNIFKLELPHRIYDCIILMNLIHDYNDKDSLTLLEGIIKYSSENSQLIIIEDILDSELEPKEVILQGLRLAVACKGGNQRTLQEMTDLLATLNFELVSRVKINNFQIMLKFKHKERI